MAKPHHYCLTTPHELNILRFDFLQRALLSYSCILALVTFWSGSYLYPFM